MTFRVYSCGSNGSFQLGNGTSDDMNVLKQVFTSKNNIKRISCGGNHTLLILEQGDLYATGDNTYGQSGVNTNEDKVKTFSIIERRHGSKWVNCSAGYEFSVLVNEDNEVYTCGFGAKGELGLGVDIKKSTLQKIDFNWGSQIIDVRSCLDHTVVLLENKTIYGIGNGRSGKLGEPAIKQIWTPRLIRMDINVTKIDTGRDFTIASDGETIRLIGKDKFDIMSKIPERFKDFKAMWSSLHLLNDGNVIVSLGNNSHGQIIPHTETKFDLFDVGSEHGLITNENKLFSWGWGEHGNCGVNKVESVTFDYINELFTPSEKEKIVLIKGGCATTWVVTLDDNE